MGWVVLAQATEPVVESPSVAWWGLVPLIVLSAGAVLLLTIASLIKPLPRWFFALWTVGVAVATIITTIPPWTRVHHHGAISTLSGMYGVDGFSLFVTAVIAAAVAIAAARPASAISTCRRVSPSTCSRCAPAATTATWACSKACRCRARWIARR